MKSPLIIASALTFGLLAAAWLFPQAVAAQDAPQPTVSQGRWVIYRVELAVGGAVDGPERSATNTVLLDSQSGDTWVLWPGDQQEKPYRWVPIERPMP